MTNLLEPRHHNPQLDPRRPTDRRPAGTNPPTFVWRPQPGQTRWALVVARDEALTDRVVELDRLDRPYHLPTRAFPPGRYYWAWGSAGAWAPTLAFTVATSDPVIEVPATDVLLARIPESHPRLLVRREDLDALRASRTATRAAMWGKLAAAAEKTLAQAHEMPEPPPVADYHTQHAQWERDYLKAMHESRAFVYGAETLALAYLASGDERCGRAAARRLVSVAAWDPAGSTHIERNDEPHMSIMGAGPWVADWVWDLLDATEQERIAWVFAERMRLARIFMDKLGQFGADTFGSHHAREAAFLGVLCIAFHDRVEGARDCFDWLRTVLGGVWPVWSGNDGAWAEGPHYASPYVGIVLDFALALRQATGTDLLARPFWKNYVQWRRWCVPLWGEWIGFGDGHKVATPGSVAGFANEIRRIAHFAGLPPSDAPCPRPYPATAEELAAAGGSALVYLLAPELAELPREASSMPPASAAASRVLRVFPEGGWAAVRTCLEDSARDVALTFRSSPFGSVSHSHADNNDFSLHLAGRSLLIPGGFYDAYESNHHGHYVWHTKSANCVTLSDAGQIMRSPEATGRIADAFEDETVAYFRGEADASYADRALRCRRHVLFLKPLNVFVLVDEFQARPGLVSDLQWNAHAWSPFETDLPQQRFTVRRDGTAVEGWFLWHAQGFFSSDHEASPPPTWNVEYKDQRPEHHLRYTPWGLVTDRRNLGVVLVPSCAWLQAPPVRTARSEAGEEAWIGPAHLTVLPDRVADGPSGGWLAALELGGRRYALGDGPLAVRPHA